MEVKCTNRVTVLFHIGVLIALIGILVVLGVLVYTVLFKDSSTVHGVVSLLKALKRQ